MYGDLGLKQVLDTILKTHRASNSNFYQLLQHKSRACPTSPPKITKGKNDRFRHGTHPNAKAYSLPKEHQFFYVLMYLSCASMRSPYSHVSKSGCVRWTHLKECRHYGSCIWDCSPAFSHD
eukprot:3495507-Pleurochrysis_carterae.AAC.3